LSVEPDSIASIIALSPNMFVVSVVIAQRYAL
jgi:hypothetical protein